jgi:hypothetical protein
VDPASAPRGEKAAHLVLIGPCDLLAVSDQMSTGFPNLITVTPWVVHTNDAGVVMAHFGHEATLRVALAPHLRDTHAETLKRLVWLDDKLLSLPALDRADVIVLSAIRNAQSASYVHRSGEFSVPFEYTRYDELVDMTRPENRQAFVKVLRTYHRIFDRVSATDLEEVFDCFADQFTFGGYVSRSSYTSTLLSLSDTLRRDQRVLVLNCQDVPDHLLRIEPRLQRVAAQHAEINAAIEDAVREDSRISVLDVRRVVQSEEDFGASGRPWHRLYHFERHVYVRLALEVVARLMEWGLMTDGLTGDMRRMIAERHRLSAAWSAVGDAKEAR